MIILHKILPILLSPIFLVGLLAAWGAVRRSPRLVWLSVVLLWILSSPIVADVLIRAVERPHRPTPLEAVDPSSAIVVLSGMLTNIELPDGRVTHEWGDPDRFFAGLDLLRKGKAPVLVWTGGRLPWDAHSRSEGELLLDEALKLGFAKHQFLLTSDVQNTADESRAVAKLIGTSEPIILVTSAFHMARSQTLFQHQGFRVTPFAVDFKAGARHITPMDFLPDAHALQRTSLALREVIGRVYYAVLT